MGGIAGLFHPAPAAQPTAEERDALFTGSSFLGDHAFLVAQARSTLARNDRYVVMVSGHFDRAPATGQSAAEVLLEYWEKLGAEALSQFDGAFIAAVFERNGRDGPTLNLIRDAFGIRRLYWAAKGGRFAFASGVRPLLDLPWVSRDLARENLAEYLSFRYNHAPRTLLRDVSVLPAGHVLVHNARGTRVEPWFKLRYSAPYSDVPPDAPTLRELEQRLNRAVASRSSGKERVGVFLSGGLDSSALTLFASRLGPVSTFTVGMEDSEGDETPYAGRVANLLHTRHEVLRVSADAFADAMDVVIGRSDQPPPDPAAMPQYLLAKAAKPHVDVILSGDGGDEVFGGRMVGLLAQEMRVSALLARLPGGGLIGRSLKGRPELKYASSPFGLSRLIGGVHAFNSGARAATLRDPGWVRKGIRRVCLEPLYREVASDPINEILHVYLRGRMAEDALPRAGTAAALAGIGLREPLLDRNLVGFMAAIPGPWKVRTRIGGPITKWPLREMLRPILGKQLVQRPKRVLPGPWRRWLTGGQPFINERIAALKEDKFKLFASGAVGSLVQNIEAPGSEGQLWTLLLLDAWLRDLKVV